MTTYYTSDLHFGHANIIKLCNRPFDNVIAMDAALIARWNSVVEDTDDVYVLGDVVMGIFAQNISYLTMLKGNIIVVPGNHDRVHPAYRSRNEGERRKWRLMYESVGVTFADDTVRHHSLAGRHDVVLCHFPYDADPLGRQDLNNYRPRDDGRWLLHGHVHEKWVSRGRQLNVGVDVWNFTPVSADTLASYIDTCKEMSGDG